MRRSSSGDLDLLLLGLLEERDHVEGRERRVTSLLRVERADPDQAMDAALGGQQPISVRPVEHERRRLDARLFAVMDLVDLHAEALLLGPPRVHAEQHVRPVLRLGAAGARLEGRDRVVIVVGTREEGGELDRLELPLETVERPIRAPSGARISASSSSSSSIASRFWRELSRRS